MFMTDDDRVLYQVRLGTEPTIPLHTLLLHTYEVERLLAHGGMGDIYLARHTDLGTKHAIKVIQPNFLDANQPTLDVLELFRREATILRGIRNDAVVSYDGFFLDEKKQYYLVMEYVDGPSLAKVLKQRVLSIDEVYLLRDRLISGLAAVHEKGVVHRDISPDNVILPEGQVAKAKLIDFGIAKLDDPMAKTIIGGAFVGKLRYMAPEQLGLFGGRVSPCSDIYSLGLVLAAAATGKPLDMGSSYETALQARQRVPDLSEVSADLRPQLTAMLQPDPADRPQHVINVVKPIQTVGEEATQPIGAVMQSTKDSAAPFADIANQFKPKSSVIRRWAILWTIVLAGIVAVILIVSFLTSQMAEQKPADSLSALPLGPISTLSVTAEGDKPVPPPEPAAVQPAVPSVQDKPELPPEPAAVQSAVVPKTASVNPPASSKLQERPKPESKSLVKPKSEKPEPAQASRSRRDGGSRPDRCADVLFKVQFGEPLSANERMFLQKECK
jgi:serine/threonine-protein kinase